MANEVTFTHRDGRLRLYDGTATPYYIEVPFINADFKAPAGRARPTQTPRLDRGRLSSLMHYIEGPDDPILGAQTLGFSFLLGNFEPNLTKLKQALNTDFAAAWTVGSNTWVSTKGSTQLLSGGGAPTLFTTPRFTNSPRNRCVNVEVLFVDPTNPTGPATGYKYAEVYLAPDKQMVNEAAEEISLQVSGEIFGSITGITAFTAGNAG